LILINIITMQQILSIALYEKDKRKKIVARWPALSTAYADGTVRSKPADHEPSPSASSKSLDRFCVRGQSCCK